MTKAFSPQGIQMLQTVEEFRSVAYQDGGGVWTCGYGHTGKDVREGVTVTTAKALVWLTQDVAPLVSKVNSLPNQFTQEQFDALVIFLYNVGAGALKDAGFASGLKSAQWATEVPRHMVLWNKIDGVVSPGLVNRRAKEIMLWNKGVYAK